MILICASTKQSVVIYDSHPRGLLLVVTENMRVTTRKDVSIPLESLLVTEFEEEFFKEYQLRPTEETATKIPDLWGWSIWEGSTRTRTVDLFHSPADWGVGVTTPEDDQFVVRLPEFDPDWVHRGGSLGSHAPTAWDRILGL